MTEISYRPSIFMGIGDLEKKIGLTHGFFNSLLREDDWSFVIKLHALFEAVCNDLLVYHIRETEIRPVVARLALNNESTGKLAFLTALRLIDKPEQRYIRALSKLRNTLVHDVLQSSFTLPDYVAALGEKGLNDFTITFSPRDAKTFVANAPEILREAIQKKNAGTLPHNLSDLYVDVDPDEMRNLTERARMTPKLHIWAGALHALINMCDKYEFSTYRQGMKVKETLIGDDDDNLQPDSPEDAS